MSADYEKAIQAFVDAGNTVIGEPAKVIGRFSIPEMKSASVIAFGKRCTLNNTTLRFPRGGGRIDFGDGCTYRSWTILGSNCLIKIGANTYFNRDTDIRTAEGAQVEIGNGCLFSDFSIRTSDMHTIFDIESGARINPTRSVVIEDDVWIGERSIIAKGARIGRGSVVGMGSIVTGAIPANSLVAGVPAKVIRSGIRWTRDLQESPALAASQPNILKGPKWAVPDWLRRQVRQ